MTHPRLQPSGGIPRIGVILVPYTGALDGATPRWDDIAAAAALAEEVGFDSVWIPDHLLFRRDDGVGGAWESTTFLAGLAATTSAVTIGSAVIATAFRNPALLAKIAATIDEISGGRFVLGIGAGWNEPEFDAFGFPTDHRASRFRESIEILAPLLREGYVDYSGRFHAAPDCTLTPRPGGPGPPIVVGTLSPRMMRITAEFADGWNAWLPRGGVASPASSRPEALQPILAALERACEDVGRDPATLSRSASVAVDTSGTGSGLVAQWGEVLTGPPARLAAELTAFGALGVDDIWLALDPPGPSGIERMAPVLAELGRSGT